MEAEIVARIIDGLSAIGLLTIGVLYLVSRRHSRNTKEGINPSHYVTQKEFKSTVAESRRLADVKHKELLDAMNVYSRQADEDRQNLFTHASDHGIHRGG